MTKTQMSHFTTGRCECEALRYELGAVPLFTHACHCLDCQRRTGSAFSMTTFVMRDHHTWADIGEERQPAEHSLQLC